MGAQVGVVSQRGDLVAEVAALVAEAGGQLVLGPLAVDTADDAGRRGDVAQRHPRHAGLDALLVDALSELAQDGARLDLHDPGVERLVVCRESESALASRRARRLGASHVVALPSGRPWLQRLLEGSQQNRSLVGVIGASGGAGATTIAIALAFARHRLLVDLDCDGAGVHLPLGIDGAPGVRWHELPATARGPLDPQSLLGALPRSADVPVLFGSVPEPGHGSVSAVVATARTQHPAAVLDLGRRDRHGVLGPHDRVVLVVPTTVAGVLAAQRALDRAGAPAVVVVRESGWLAVADVVAELGSPAWVRVPRLRRAAELAECGQLMSGATGRRLLRIGAELGELLP